MDLHVSIFFSWAFMCPFFFQYIAHALIRENFWERLYGTWNIKEDMNEWMVWKCYPSGVEVLAYGDGVCVILDHVETHKGHKI